MGDRFRPPRDFDEWLYQAHVLQARAMAIGIEWMRANQPRCMGALFWQFNDAWAGHSWSCIDSSGRRKPLWYAARRAFAPRLLTIQPFDDELRLVAINESAEPWTVGVTLQRMRFTGECMASHCFGNRVRPHSTWHSRVPIQSIVDGVTSSTEYVVASDGESGIPPALWVFDPDRVLHTPEPGLRATASRRGEEVHLTLHSPVLVRDAVIAVDRVDPKAEIDDNLITLLPGEERTLRIRTSRDVDVATWISPPVFRCANEFSAEARPASRPA
jgi:beta-mannosidase